jgi:dihydroorotate dehydrogenase
VAYTQDNGAHLMKPWLWLPPTWSHLLAPHLLPILAYCGDTQTPQWRPFHWRGVHFQNPLGVAGGVDKEGHQLTSWQALGAGFVEVGTITPLPQTPNPGKIMDRQLSSLSLWNKMGFPNQGVHVLKNRLEQIGDKLHIPLFINIGKNRDTPNENAYKDYLTCIKELKQHTKVFVVNISSPNTKGLRDLQSLESLRNLLKPLRQEATKHSLLLKLSPDMEADALKDLLDLCLTEQINGVILTNTTLQRPNNSLPYSTTEGGVSGAPLKELARKSLLTAVKHVGGDREKLLLVSVGGITDTEEVQWRLDHGAHLVQTYSALVFQGPFFFKKVAKALWQQ